MNIGREARWGYYALTFQYRVSRRVDMRERLSLETRKQALKNKKKGKPLHVGDF